MRILEEFWYGNLEPNGVDITKGSEFDKLLRLLCKNEDKLRAILDQPKTDLFQKYQDTEKDINQLNECEIFVRGFRLGARIMIEVMSDDNKQIGIIED